MTDTLTTTTTYQSLHLTRQALTNLRDATDLIDDESVKGDTSAPFDALIAARRAVRLAQEALTEFARTGH